MIQERIQGIGIDIIEIGRVRRLSEKWGDRFEKRVFTSQELTYCGRTVSRFARLAARFAAKEATFKALGTGLTIGMHWQDVEICANDAGKPFLVLHGIVKKHAEQLSVVSSYVSMSHAVDFAVAQVILTSAV